MIISVPQSSEFLTEVAAAIQGAFPHLIVTPMDDVDSAKIFDKTSDSTQTLVVPEEVAGTVTLEVTQDEARDVNALTARLKADQAFVDAVNTALGVAVPPKKDRKSDRPGAHAAMSEEQKKATEQSDRLLGMLSLRKEQNAVASGPGSDVEDED